METKISNKYIKVLEYFFNYPNKSTYIRELSKEIGVSHTWVRRIINDLIKKGILIGGKKIVFSIKANKDFDNYKRYKRTYNLYKVYSSGLLDYLIEEYSNPEAIILFGSYSYGEDNEKSDIDISIISYKKQNIVFEKFEKKLKRKISIHEFEPNNITEEFLNTLANGIILYGYLNSK